MRVNIYDALDQRVSFNKPSSLFLNTRNVILLGLSDMNTMLIDVFRFAIERVL